MFCQYCGASIEPNAKFCAVCGGSVADMLAEQGAAGAAPGGGQPMGQGEGAVSPEKRGAHAAQTVVQLPENEQPQQSVDSRQDTLQREVPQQAFLQQGVPQQAAPRQDGYAQPTQQLAGQQFDRAPVEQESGVPFGSPYEPPQENASYSSQAPGRYPDGGSPYRQQTYDRGEFERLPNEEQHASQGQKRSGSPILIVVIVVVLVALALILASALGVFSPGGGGGAVPAGGQGASQGSVQSPSGAASSATDSSAASSAGAPAASSAAASASGKTGQQSASGAAASQGAAQSAASSASASSSSSASSADAKQLAINRALAQGYQVFEGTLRIVSASELASMQNVDPKMFTEGTLAVLVLDSPVDVKGMSGDGSGMRTESAKMLGVAEYTDYGSLLIDKGNLDSWRAYDGKHIAVGAMAEQIWFPSDVSLPIGEPRTEFAVVLG